MSNIQGSLTNTSQYILLPGRGLRGESSLVSDSAREFLGRLSTQVGDIRPMSFSAVNRPETTSAQVRIVDSIAEQGAKLIELDDRGVDLINRVQPGIRLVPVRYYTPALAPRPSIQVAATAFAGMVGLQPPTIRLTVVDSQSQAPIAGATVVAFTNFASRSGAQGVTSANGTVSLSLGASQAVIDRLYIYPHSGYWPFLSMNTTLSSSVSVNLTPISLDFVDGLRHIYGQSSLTAGEGVTVGVGDTGVAANHPDLTVAGGANLVPGEDPADFGDNGEGHGTHVAGIIAARGTAPTGVRGMAPGVSLRSYRVFPQGTGGASNWAIAKAIDQAISDGCDLLNLSLGGGSEDPTLQTAINDARQNGLVVICASGNDNRSPVSFPGSDPLALAVSALGREGTYPAGAEEHGNVQRPPTGNDPLDYITSFSNVGPNLSLTAPGDGIISTFPGGYAVLDGTSMACPAATGRAAAILAADDALMAMPRDVNRSDAIVSKLLLLAKPLGFGAGFEGRGLLP